MHARSATHHAAEEAGLATFRAAVASQDAAHACAMGPGLGRLPGKTRNAHGACLVQLAPFAFFGSLLEKRATKNE